MGSTTEGTASEVERAIPEVLRAVAEATDERYASDVIARVHKETGIREEAIRHAIWRLITHKKIQLTDERELALPAPEYSQR